ncbi:unnamed protein product [Oppiella nova]|uniref:Nose resistant-to-fluoxetine protein N-terminal domain-containing protein n=1 Tax=Oppiella nova TaxID=334625 RepID=A0A7R9M2A8_9ACAR|nr:unnamed protein product [Oppiella nova]CAG2169386.1 unnamed protein product [Oppiella nova]
MFSVVDAMGKLPAGFLEGTVTSFGNVDECTDILVPDDDYDDGFHGKYCLLYLRPEVPRKVAFIKHTDYLFNLTGTPAEGTVFEHLSQVFTGIYSVGAIRLGVCVPSNCQNGDIKPLLTQIFKPYKIDADLSEKCLSKHDSRGLTVHQKVSLALLSVMTLLVAMGSLSDIITNGSNGGLVRKSLHCWSLLRNYDQLVSPSGKRNRLMAAVHGIRVLTIIWTTINHTYTFGGFYKIQWTYKSLSQVRKVPESFMFQLVFNAWALVETFFFLRMIPSVCGIIAVNFLWPLLTTGPILIDDSTDTYVTNNCHNNWWHNLLLINNWFSPDDICLINTWYLSADFQMYVEYHLKYGYFPTFQHFGPYCMGIFVGYFILNTPNNYRLPQTQSIISWIVCPLISLSVLLFTYNWNNGVEPSRLSSILYSSLSRTIWCTGLSWITYVCCIGSGGVVNRLLSHPVFVPLSRLSFGVYLSHLVIIFIIFFTRKSVTDWTHFDFLTNGMVTIILSYVLALVLYFLLEAPFANFEKILISNI